MDNFMQIYDSDSLNAKAVLFSRKRYYFYHTGLSHTTHAPPFLSTLVLTPPLSKVMDAHSERRENGNI